MNFDSFISCKKTDNVDVPAAFIGLRILLVDHDITSLSNIATTLEKYSFKVTIAEQATVALSILREHMDQFDLVMMDVNMREMDYLEFIKSTQLIKDIPIILMSSKVKIEMVKEAMAQGVYFTFMKPILSEKLKNVWRHVDRHQKKANKKSQYNEANQVETMNNTTCAKKQQDQKGKSLANSSDTYQDQVVSLFIEKYEDEEAKRMRSTNEETQVKGNGTSEKEEDHSLVSKISTKIPQKKRCRQNWTSAIDMKFNEVVHNLGEKAHPKLVLEMMSVPDLTQDQVTYHLKKFRVPKQQALHVQPTTLINFKDGHHFNVLNSKDFSTNFDEPPQGVYIPQPLAVPPSPNDFSLNWCDDWNEFLEIDNFNGEIMGEKHINSYYNWLDYVPVRSSSTQHNVSISKRHNP